MGDEDGEDSSGLCRDGSKMTRTSSRSNMIDKSPPGIIMSVSKINALRASISKHEETFTRLMLSSKDTIERKAQIESAFRVCKEAFLDVSSVLAHLLEEKSSEKSVIREVRRVVMDALREDRQQDASRVQIAAEGAGASVAGGSVSYASAVGSKPKPKVHVSRGPTVEVRASTSFLVVPQENKANDFPTSQATKDALCRVFKPSDCELRINNVSFVRKNCIRINAISPDLERLKRHQGLAEAGLKIVENTKTNPRLIVYGIPTDMSSEEIAKEISAQNLQGLNKTADVLKVVYIYPAKDNKRATSCVLEVSPEVRNLFMARNRIYLRFNACKFADHVRVLQCYKCLAFGHLAKTCKSAPLCGHCGEAHEMKNCTKRELAPRCGNCLRLNNMNDLAHEATDAKKCPILNKKITARIANINYG
ncbi:uncharacterized protein LOC109862001 [Pseudomyrmex gracilis]|uniref:uncharacterized protein LOC109862001 n=1 Tax=Pseudomyrmex gracilis TaxID=219809 RepID=UPI0009950562|nr:uncharacterized protein LOC109862001 [Pseudomyrmex gracilis]